MKAAGWQDGRAKGNEMGWVSGIATFLVIWWTVIFAVLPWGVRRQEDPVAGTEVGAPERPRLALKMAVTTVIAALLWLCVYGIVESDLISFRDMARDRIDQ